MYREHPLKILRYSAKNIWLLIFPLLRGVKTIRFDPESFYRWVRGAWFDIAVIGVIILFGYVRWNFSGIELNDNEIIRRERVPATLKTVIPYENLSAVTIEKPVYLLPIKALKISFDTSSGAYKSADMKIMVTEKFLEDLVKRIPDVRQENKSDDVPRTTPLAVIMFSLFFSSGFSGTVYIATLFMKGGDIARDLINMSIDRLTETTEKLTNKFIIHIPSAVALVGVFFIATWLLSFIMNLTRYAGFRAEEDESYLKIVCGLLTRREYRIKREHINYKDLRQNLIMKFMKKSAVNISCAGYGSEKNQLPVLYLVSGNDDERARIKNDFIPQRNAIMQYIWISLPATLSVIPAHLLISHFFPSLSELTLFLAVMAKIPLLWLTVCDVTSFFTSGISVRDDTIIIRCSKLASFHTVIANVNNITKLEIRQTIFQKMSNRCNIVLWLGSEEKAHFMVKAMDTSDVRRIISMLGYPEEIKL